MGQNQVYFEIPKYCHYRINPLNERYGLRRSQGDYEMDNFVIVDMFHGEERYFPVISEDFSLHHFEDFYFRVYYIDTNLLFSCVYSFDETQASIFYLLQIDVGASECTVLDKVNINEIKKGSIVFDRWNRRNFVLIKSSDLTDEKPVFVGRLENNQIFIEQTDAKIDHSIMCLSLNENLLCGFKLDKQNKLFYWELDLDGTVENEGSNKFKLTLDQNIDPCYLFNGHSAYTWLNNLCYVSLSPDKKSPQKHVFVFNIETQECRSFVVECLEIDFMAVDSNEILSVQTSNKFGRFTLRQPDTLKMLSWFAIRRYSLSDDNKLYETALKLLPLNSDLRPFYFSI